MHGVRVREHTEILAMHNRMAFRKFPNFHQITGNKAGSRSCPIGRVNVSIPNEIPKTIHITNLSVSRLFKKI
jgi:hypothetical protein